MRIASPLVATTNSLSLERLADTCLSPAAAPRLGRGLGNTLGDTVCGDTICGTPSVRRFTPHQFALVHLFARRQRVSQTVVYRRCFPDGWALSGMPAGVPLKPQLERPRSKEPPPAAVPLQEAG